MDTISSRNLLIASVNEIEEKFIEGSRQTPPMSYQARSPLIKQKGELLDQYFSQLPKYAFSQCPFCNVRLVHAFDPWGLDGFWWQEELSGRCPEPSACEHFRLLTGALNLKGLPPLGGKAESYPGPEVPYVIPKVLEFPTMVAVVSSIQMKNGYTAYPIAYFSLEKPSTTALAHPWRKTSCDFTTDDGQPAFTYKTDPWDFELMPWVQKGAVKWIDPEDTEGSVRSAPANGFPYNDMPGVRMQQTIENNLRFTKSPPHNEVIDPFSE